MVDWRKTNHFRTYMSNLISSRFDVLNHIDYPRKLQRNITKHTVLHLCTFLLILYNTSTRSATKLYELNIKPSSENHQSCFVQY